MTVRFNVFFCGVLFWIFFPLISFGQDLFSIGNDSIYVSFHGTAQPQFTYGKTGDDQNLGFGIRRARLRMNTVINHKFFVFLQVEGGSNVEKASLIDYKLGYQPHPSLRLNLGRMVSAQPESATLTSHTRIDAVDRATIAGIWSQNTIGSDGRDYGLEVHYQSKGKNLRLFVHNGYNKGNFYSGLGKNTVVEPEASPSMALSIQGSYELPVVEGLEIGTYAGINNKGNSNTQYLGEERGYFTYSGHLYWGKNPGERPIRFKTDFIGVNYDRVNQIHQHFRGYSILGAFAPISYLEIFARGEWLDDYNRELNAANNDLKIMTTGISFSIAALQDESFNDNKITFAYGAKYPQNEFLEESHLFQCQYQVTF